MESHVSIRHFMWYLNVEPTLKIEQCKLTVLYNNYYNMNTQRWWHTSFPLYMSLWKFYVEHVTCNSIYRQSIWVHCGTSMCLVACNTLLKFYLEHTVEILCWNAMLKYNMKYNVKWNVKWNVKYNVKYNVTYNVKYNVKYNVEM